MKKHILPGILLAMFAFTAGAQPLALPVKWSFYSINQAGLINGRSGSAFQAQTVNGMQKGHVFMGLGVGTDQYYFASVPVFVDTRYYIGRQSSAPFVYADGGINFPTTKDRDAYPPPGFLSGFYSDAGIGYLFATGHKTALLLSAGMTYKRIIKKQAVLYMEPPFYYDPGGPPSLPFYRYIYDLNRLSFKLGFRF